MKRGGIGHDSGKFACIGLCVHLIDMLKTGRADMNGRMAKKLRKEARRIAAGETEKMIPEFKAFVNTKLTFPERFGLACKIIWKRF